MTAYRCGSPVRVTAGQHAGEAARVLEDLGGLVWIWLESGPDVRVRRTSVEPTRRRFAWTDARVSELRRDYRAFGAAVIAARFNIPVHRVYNAAKRYGVSAPMRYVVGPKFDRFVRSRHKRGWCDAEIAAAWSAANPAQRCSREVTGQRRRELGLPSNRNSNHYRRRVAAKTREQLTAAGVSNLAEVRRLRYQQFARDRGWPVDLPPRCVQILDLLYEQGPQTRVAIAEKIGWNMQRGQRPLLNHSQSPGGSYLTNLMHRGLVHRLAGRVVKGELPGQSRYLYAIPIHVKRGGPWPEQKETTA